MPQMLYITLAQVLKLYLVSYNALARALEFSLALYIPNSRNNKTDFILISSHALQILSICMENCLSEQIFKFKVVH